MSIAAIAFWAASSILAWVYAGYPALALAWGRLRPLRLRGGPTNMPRRLTIGIALHGAAHELDERIANAIAEGAEFELEVIVASDGSDPAVGEVIARLAASESRLRYLALPRVGQAAAQDAIFEAAEGEVVLLTDAETRFAPGCVAALLAPLADERVACTTGTLRWRFDRPTSTSRHEGSYWRYEQAVRRWESRAGWLSSATGALLAVRRSTYRPAAAHASLDQMLPLYARQQGLHVVAVEDALGTDRGPSSLADQFRSRVRIATQGIEANLGAGLRLAPWRQPGPLLAIWSHKLLRWATPWLVITALAAAAALVVGGQPLYGLPLAIGAIVAGLAVLGAAGQAVGRPLVLTGLPLTIAAVNLAFAVGWLRVLARKRISSW
jgi:cellulose synthase/poly-beta-1,6-N-acetylglucosamine synthase-like glycosyltransferase